MAFYRHSVSFASLKGIKETLEGNLSTIQYMRILDSFLTQSLEPLITKTSFIDGHIARALSWTTKNSRRRLSMDRHTDIMKLSFLFILDQRPSKKLEIWKQLKMDRAMSFYMIEDFLEKMEQIYLPAANCELELPNNFYGDPIAYYRQRQRDVETTLRCSGSLLDTYHSVRYWYLKAKSFKHVILEKYTRLCLTSAQRDYRSFFNCEIELDDIVQSYLFMASRAIDRCDANQGALTSHVQNWFLTARSSLNKQRLNRGTSLEANQLVDLTTSITPELSVEESSHIAAVAAFADPEGLGRYYLGFEERLPISSPHLFKATVKTVN
jgi:hypothetical protein